VTRGLTPDSVRHPAQALGDMLNNAAIGCNSAGQAVRFRGGERVMLQAVARSKRSTGSQSEKNKERLREIIGKKSFLRGEFKLASGVPSDYYLDMKKTMFDPEGSAYLTEVVYDLMKDEDIDAIGGLELGAVPILGNVCARSWPDKPITAFVVRKAKKGHGTDNQIDGNFKPGSTVILFDDVTTTGGSVMQAVKAVREQGATIKKIITIVDRLEGAKENLAKEGVELVPIFTRDDFTRS
jgi:orotate phosphoribosyltransferase